MSQVARLVVPPGHRQLRRSSFRPLYRLLFLSFQLQLLRHDKKQSDVEKTKKKRTCGQCRVADVCSKKEVQRFFGPYNKSVAKKIKNDEKTQRNKARNVEFVVLNDAPATQWNQGKSSKKKVGLPTWQKMEYSRSRWYALFVAAVEMAWQRELVGRKKKSIRKHTKSTKLNSSGRLSPYFIWRLFLANVECLSCPFIKTNAFLV